MVSLQKKQQQQQLTDLLKKTENFLLIKLDRITHQNLENLRKELKKSNSKIKVVKNTLFEKALNFIKDNQLIKDLKKTFLPLTEKTALITFSNDWITGLKKINEYINKEKTLNFRFGILEKNLYSDKELAKLALLPSREELLGKIIGSMKAPINRLIYSMKFNTNKLVYVLKEKSKSN